MAERYDLTPEELNLLVIHLDRYIDHLDAELIRTEKRDLQHALAREIDQLRSIARRLEAASTG